MMRPTLLVVLILVKVYKAEILVPSGLWEQCLRANMPAEVVSAVYGGCAGQKCAKLRFGNFWEHCVDADEEFADAIKDLYGENRADRCITIMKAKQDSLVDESVCEPNPCRNDGYCRASESGEYRCTCRPAFRGKICESLVKVCDPNPCLNDGYCEAMDSDASETFTCKCRMGFSGKKCERVIHVCSPNPCQNGGYCQANGTDAYFCSCYPGFGGLNCEYKISACSTNPCKNQGFCVENGLKEYNCICLDGFSGKNCETRVSVCDSNPCLNGGQCVERKSANRNTFICNCPYQYGGRLCETKVEPPLDCAQLVEGDYADPSICPSQMFYRCKDGLGFFMRCGKGKYFSKRRRGCTYRWNVQCH